MKSLALLAMAALVVGCSGSKDVEQASVSELYTKGSNALQEGGYSEAIRYLKAANERFPGSIYQEQAMIDLIYANYKSQNYTDIETLGNDFIRMFPQSQNQPYVIYMTGLAYSAMSDNFIQDFFGIDRATRETVSMRNAFNYFQGLVTHFPNSPYTQDALARMAYIKAALAQATYEGLFLMKEAYNKMGLTTLENQTQQIIDANKGKSFEAVEKPKEPELTLPKVK